MVITEFTITDSDACRNEQQFAVRAEDIPGTPAGWSVVKRTLRGGLSEGVELIEINNGRMTLWVIPTRGMGIWRAAMSKRTLGWQSPVRRPVHPAFVPLGEPSGLGWLAGFNELVARCGLVSNGAPDFDEQGRLLYGLHGRIANLPAHRVEVAIDETVGTIALSGVVEEARFGFGALRLTSSLTTEFGSASFTWTDVVENIGGRPAGMQMLYHINIGEPLLDAGSQLLAPVHQLAPRDTAAADADPRSWHTYPAPSAGSAEQVYYFECVGDDEANTRICLSNRAGTEGVGLRFNLGELPHFVQWRNTAAPGDGYVTGLEPATNFPNSHTFEEQQGRVVPLEPGGRWQATVTLDWLTHAAEIATAKQEIAELQGNIEPHIHLRPHSGWSP